jgi:hypothetical protein
MPLTHGFRLVIVGVANTMGLKMIEDIPASEIAIAFESLGGSGHGCEFGLFQREMQAEPLGLLRWADLSYDYLREAIENSFEGVGDPENTIVFIPPGTNSHYWSRDSRWWMAQGFHVPASRITIEQAKQQICRRQQFLRRKLLEDLQEGSKIFVYKNNTRTLSDIELSQLLAAIRRHGSAPLLYVRVQDEQHPDGTVEYVEDGLFIGYIKHFSHSPNDEFLGMMFDSWLTICRNTYSQSKMAAPR